MSDPRSWAFPLGRLFGITIRIHWLFPLMAIALVLRAAYGGKNEPPTEGAWIDATLIVTFLFVSVLLHEFGHCFAARWVDGDASEVLLWPLGGLATVDVPHTPRANFLVARRRAGRQPGPVPGLPPGPGLASTPCSATALEPFLLSVPAFSFGFPDEHLERSTVWTRP